MSGLLTTKASILRSLLRGKGVAGLGGAHDGLGAKIVEEAGFDAVWASGLEISASRGVPDAGILSLERFLDAADGMNQAVKIPILADCDTGFDDIARTVREYEDKGIAGISVEDKVFPKVNSLLDRHHKLASRREFASRIRSALQARSNPDFVFVARVESFIAGRPLRDALERAAAYEDAGADAIIIHSKDPSYAEIARFMEQWPKKTPIIVIPTMYPRITKRDLERMGVRAAIFANHGLRAAIRSMQEILSEIALTGSAAGVENRIAPLAEVFRLQGERNGKHSRARK